MLEPIKPRDYKDQCFAYCCRFAYSMIWFHLFSNQDNQYNRFAQACSLQYTLYTSKSLLSMCRIRCLVIANITRAGLSPSDARGTAHRGAPGKFS